MQTIYFKKGLKIPSLCIIREDNILLNRSFLPLYPEGWYLLTLFDLTERELLQLNYSECFIDTYSNCSEDIS